MNASGHERVITGLLKNCMPPKPLQRSMRLKAANSCYCRQSRNDGEKWERPLADARGSERRHGFCGHLPSRDRGTPVRGRERSWELC